LASTELPDGLQLPAEYAARVASLRRLIGDLDFEIDLFAGLIRGRLVRDPGYQAVQTILTQADLALVVSAIRSPSHAQSIGLCCVDAAHSGQ